MKNNLSFGISHHVSRRSALKQTFAFLGFIVTGQKLMAQNPPVCPPPPPKFVKVIESEIAKNHGHEFTMTLSDLIKQGGATLDIQGDSGHPHHIVVSNDQIISLMKGEEVVLVSSKDAGHTHQVKLLLVEKEVDASIA